MTGDDFHADDFPQHDDDPVADALGWARAVGLHVFAPDDSAAVWVHCSGCGAELGVPTEPLRPRAAARRVRTFIARHHRHLQR